MSEGPQGLLFLSLSEARGCSSYTRTIRDHNIFYYGKEVIYMVKTGDYITIKTELSADGEIECIVNNIDKGYIHANPINPDGTISFLELVVPVNSDEIIS